MNEKLNKKLVIEKSEKKEEGSLFLGFIVVLFITALVVGTIVFLEVKGYTDIISFI